jgi:hypothetical protein
MLVRWNVVGKERQSRTHCAALQHVLHMLQFAFCDAGDEKSEIGKVTAAVCRAVGALVGCGRGWCCRGEGAPGFIQAKF